MEATTKRKVKLYGDLAVKFGHAHELAVPSAAGAVRLMEANHPGHFLEAIRDGRYYVVAGRDLDGLGLTSEEELRTRLGYNDLHIVPEAYGAGGGAHGKGLLSVVLGVVLIGAAFFTGGLSLAAGTSILGISTANVALFGAALFFGGINALLAPKQKAPKDTATGDTSKSSFLFSGPVNSTAQGGARPLIYGRLMVGSTIISASVRSVDIALGDTSGGSVAVTTPPGGGINVGNGIAGNIRLP